MSEAGQPGTAEDRRRDNGRDASLRDRHQAPVHGGGGPERERARDGLAGGPQHAGARQLARLYSPGVPSSVHHVDSSALTRHDFVETHGDDCTVAALPLAHMAAEFLTHTHTHTPGWCNCPLDLLGFWRRMERLIEYVTGHKPHCDDMAWAKKTDS